MPFENRVFTVFYQKLFAITVYINKNIAKAQPRLRGQVKSNQIRYYTSIYYRFKNWFDKVVSTMEQKK